MKTYKSAVHIRGDCLYCPLSLSVDSYWNCLTKCLHCYTRRLNRTWGEDLRPAAPDEVRRQLNRGLKNKNPKTPLAHALNQKKTIRFGDRSDPYQKAELVYGISRRLQVVFIDLEWTYVIETKFLNNLRLDEDVIEKAKEKSLIQIMPIISPGAESDWEILEQKKTDPIPDRLKQMKRWIEKGHVIGVNGEPFIPGYHTPAQFQAIIRRLKEIGVTSYNTYNLHFNDLVAKNLHSVGIDIERIWYYNQDKNWRPILQKLMDIAKAEDMPLGCPDFVNTGWKWREPANTCCGIDVPNPTKFNSHMFKCLCQQGVVPDKILQDCWDGVGTYEDGMDFFTGDKTNFYGVMDIK